MLDSPSNLSETKSEPAYGDIWYWWRNLQYMFREQMFLGLAVFLCIFCIDIYLYKSATRIYKSQTTFVVDQSPYQFAVNQNDVEGSRLLLQSIISSIISFDMRDSAAARLNVSPSKVCILSLGPPPLSLKHKDEVNISVTTERGSRVASIEAESSDPQFASRAAQAVLEEVLGMNRLVGHLNSISQTLSAAQAKVDKYVQNVAEADASRSMLEQEVFGIDRHLKAGGSLESAPAFSQDQALIDLQKKRIDSDAAFYAQEKISTRGEQLRALKGAKENVDLQIREYLHNKEISVRSSYNEAIARVNSLNTDLNQELQTFAELQNQKTQLTKAVGDFSARKQLSLSDQPPNVEEAGVILVFDRARPAWRASKPKLIIYLASGLVLSLMLSIGLMFLRHNLDRFIRYPQQIESTCGVPCLAVLPESIHDRQKGSLDYVPERETVSGLSYLRNQLLRASLMGLENRIFTFMDLGANPVSSEWVSQLGWLLACAGKPTLLVDLDFTNPRLAEVLNIRDKRGLSDWVHTEQPLSDFIQKSEVEQLGLLQPGKLHSQVDQELARRPLALELAKLQESWSFILIYAPSLLKNPHLLLAAPPHCPIISLVEYGKSTLDDLEESITRCESCNFRFAGVVLHHFPHKKVRNRKNHFGLGPHRYIFDSN